MFSLINPIARPRESVRIEASVCSDIGCQRERNEDAVLLVRLHDHSDSQRENVLVLIADGMGGHQAGDVASRTAIDTVTKRFGNPVPRHPRRTLKAAVQTANQTIYALSQAEPRLTGMGTTITALIIANGYAHFAHVGDTRLYRMRDGVLSQLTDDHTLVQAMVRDGMLDATSAKRHPHRNIVTRALGTRPCVDVDINAKPIPVRQDDCFLLCSDGLHDLVDHMTLQDALTNWPPQEACDRLLMLARDAGGHDNISLAILRVVTSPTPALSVPRTRTDMELPAWTH